MSHWTPPAGAAVRGTVILLPGRGEHAGVYERFGRRLAADGYPVHALDAQPDPVEVARLAAGAVPPVVLAGADTGALRALALALALAAPPYGGAGLAGLVLAGAADPAGRPAVDTVRLGWSAELGARTACPSHQTRLTGDPAFTRGELWAPVPPDLAATVAGPSLDELDLPVLLVHGDADTVAPVRAAEAIAARLRRAELVTVHEGRHDILNDAPHRTVAAHVVQWLERVRNGPDAVPILAVRQPFHDHLASPA